MEIQLTEKELDEIIEALCSHAVKLSVELSCLKVPEGIDNIRKAINNSELKKKMCSNLLKIPKFVGRIVLLKELLINLKEVQIRKKEENTND